MRAASHNAKLPKSEGSEIEKVRDLVREKPGKSAKELATVARKKGLSLTKREMNAVLYKLLALGEVSNSPGSGTLAPNWHPSYAVPCGPAPTSTSNTPSTDYRKVSEQGSISEERVKRFTQLILEDGETVSVGLVAGSANDPYMSLDLLDERIVITVNTQHPGFASLAHSDASMNIFIASVVIDAVSQTRLKRAGDVDVLEMEPRTRDSLWREFALLAELLPTPTEALSRTDP